MAEISIKIDEPGRGTRELKFTKPVITIGRSSGCDVRVADDQVSSRHARLRIYSDHALIEDQNSTNGLVVDGVPIAGSAEIGLNNVIRLGANGPTLSVTRGLPLLVKSSTANIGAGPRHTPQIARNYTKYYLFAAAAAIGFIFIGGSLLLSGATLYWLKSRPTGLITSVHDETHIREAVGLVISAWQRQDHDPPIIEQLLTTTGTAFAVSEQGFLITNNHVVHEPTEKDLIGAIGHVDLNDEKQVAEAAKIINYYRNLRSQRIPWKHWVAFHGEIWEAQVVYQSPNQDLCVLKVNRQLPYVFSLFRLSTRNGKILMPQADLAPLDDPALLTSSGKMRMPRDLPVVALGFPGASEFDGFDAQAAMEQEKSKDVTNVKTLYSKQQYEYKVKRGAISNVTNIRGKFWIEHSAPTFHGSSGGPICRDDGVVLGVNTAGNHATQGYNEAFVVGVYEDELLKVVKDIRWAQ
jgi:pSer/pThr/pTyr-binding forkhead associated (FHA) protein